MNLPASTTNAVEAQPLAVGASYQDMPIHDLQDAIRKENCKARSLARKSLEHVRSCGEMLIALKAKTGHGNWKYMFKSLNMSQKTASNYMRIASNWQRVADMDHGVKDALALLCRQDSPPPSPRSAPRRSPALVIIDAEVVEPSAPTIEDKIVVKVATPLPPSAPAPNDAFLTILELIPELDQSELKKLITIIDTRWMRGEEEGV